MTPEPEPAEPTEAEWVRRKRLEAVFGDVLPESTTDDLASPERVAESASDTWLREQVPPHHG